MDKYISTLIFINWISAIYAQTDPLFTNLPYTINIPEDTNARKIMKVKAVDISDDDKPKIKRYFIPSIDPTNANAFEIDEDGGNKGNFDIKNNHGFDITVEPSYAITICAVDEGGDDVCAVLTVNLIQSSFPPILANIPTTINIDEDQASGTSIFQVYGTDPDGDTITYSIDSKNPTNAPFTINTANGRITTTAVIDYETDPLTYTLDIFIADNRYTVGPETLTINIDNVNEEPVITNLPDSASIQEDVTLGYDLFTVTSSDLDGDTLTYTMVTSPETGPFQCVAVDDTRATIKVVDNPGFDYERISTYVLTFFVMDGQALAPPKSFTVSITNANEALAIQNLPDTVNIPEDRTDATDIFSVYSTDIDIGDTSTYTITSVIPSTATSIFTINSATGVISTIADPGFDYEDRTSYTLNIEAEDSGRLTDTGVLTIQILNANEEPSFPQSPLIVNVDEELAVGSVVPVTIAATDPDGDTLTYLLQSTTNSDFFAVAGDQLQIAQRIDFENAFHPRIVSLEIIARDAGGREATLYVLLTVKDINDNVPTFSSSSYNVTLAENSIGGTSVVTVYARDLDSGSNGEFVYEIADTLGNLYFTIDEDTGLITVKQPADMEASTVISFEVEAVSTNGDSGSATVNVYLSDVNDNRPSLISELFELEIPADAGVGQYVGKLEGTDNDFTQTSLDLTYSMSSRSEYFSLESLNGHITVKSVLNENPPEDYRSFILHTAVLDNGNPPLVSTYRPVRIDTYKPCEVLMNFTLVVPSSTFTSSSNVNTFVSSVQSIMPDTRAEMVYVDGQHIDTFVPPTGAIAPKCTVTMLFINSLTVIDIDNLFTYQKTFRMVPEILAILTKDENGSPSTTLLTSVDQGSYPIQTVESYKACPVPVEEPINWWLDTVPGNVTIGMLSFLGLLLLGTAIGLIIYYCCVKRGLCFNTRWPGSQNVPKFTRTKGPETAPTKEKPPETARTNRAWKSPRSTVKTNHGTENPGYDQEQYDFRYSRNDDRAFSPMSARSVEIELKSTPPPRYTPYQ